MVVEALWHRASVGAGEFGHTFSQLLGVLCHAIFRGQNVHQIIWKNDGDLIYPARFEQLAPQYLQWEMAPGKVDRLLLVPDGEAAKPVPFPQYKFIVALNNTGPDHPLYNASYYSLVAWFSAFKKGLGWFMEFCQQYGLPKPVFHYDNPEDKEALIRDLNDKRVINAILLEGDRSVDWANVPAGGQSLPQRELLNMAEAAVHKAILGQTLTSDVSKSGGSLAQAKVHAGVQADTVMRYAEFVQEVVNSQLIPAIVHLNYGKTDVPMPELRCKLPQAVANIERAQFWGQVLQIPGMQVVKSDVYDSLGIAMPGEGDETLQAPSQEAGAAGGLLAALQGGGKGKERKDEVALAARAKGEEPTGIEGWLAPLKKKLLEAKKAGASFDELKQMMLEARLNTHALAGAMEENIRQGFYGDEDELEAANPYGCNQYGHGFTKECGRGGGRGGQKTFDFFDSVKKDEDKDRFKQNREQRENEKAYKEAEANYLTECSNLDSLGKELDDWQKPEEKWGGGIDLNTLMGRYKEQFEKTKEARLKQAEAARKAGKKLNFYDGKDESLYEIDSQLWNKYEDVFNEDDELKAASAEDCEDVEAGKKRLNNPVPQADGKRCYTENCSWHKGTTREGETQPNQKKHVKTKDGGNVIYQDDRCSVIKYKNGKLEVHIHSSVTTEEDAVKAIEKLISQCREKRKGQLRGKPDFGYVSPGERIEFFVSRQTISESAQNEYHIKRSDNKEAHYSAASVIDQLWQAAQEGIRRKPKKDTPKDREIKWVHERYATLKINKQKYKVKMTAFEYEKEQYDNLLYDIMVSKQ